MAIGDLLYEKVIDFSTNPSVPMSMSTSGSSITSGYDAGSQTFQASIAGFHGHITLTGEPFNTTHDCELEMTVKMTADNQVRKHFGLWLMNETGTVPTGYRNVGLDNTKVISRYDNGTETTLSNVSDPGFNINQIYKLRVRRTGSLIEFFVDDVLKGTGTSATYTNLRPGIFLYGCTIQVSQLVWRHRASALDAMEFRTIPITATPANQEPRAQFQPQDIDWRGGTVFAGPQIQLPIKPNSLFGLDAQAWLSGQQLFKQGYIESTVTISGEGVSRRVLCFDQAGNLIAETRSRASDGKYRFDRLMLNNRYMLVAQDDPAFGPADYNAVAADYQQPTPYAPGEGVGLTGG